MAAITISEALGWRDILKARQNELVQLRNENSRTTLRYIGANADKSETVTPTYDVKKLDALISNLAKELRLLDSAMKKTNATINVVGYDQNDAILGVVE